jgi:hypothetical protein
MRYYLDTEYNGFGGALISIALVPADGGEEFYATLPLPDPVEAWVERNVLPYLDTVPVGFQGEALDRQTVTALLGNYFAADPAPEIVADWPDDIAYFCGLLVTGPGLMVPTPPLSFRLVQLPGFSTAENSAVPHNALHDARALRDHCESLFH